jgi:hypothetical protein
MGGASALRAAAQPAAPVLCDVAEQPVLDLVPFRRAGRIVVDADHEPGLVSQPCVTWVHTFSRDRPHVRNTSQFLLFLGPCFPARAQFGAGAITLHLSANQRYTTEFEWSGMEREFLFTASIVRFAHRVRRNQPALGHDFCRRRGISDQLVNLRPQPIRIISIETMPLTDAAAGIVQSKGGFAPVRREKKVRHVRL